MTPKFNPGLLLLILGLSALAACLPEAEKITVDNNARLRFSSDSVKFDTVFTSLQSTTRRLKVYNDSRNAVRISNVSLSGGSTSPFEITVNGLNASEQSDVLLFGGDSLLVLVDALLDPRDEDLPFLVTDEIRFETNGNLQVVKIVAYGQDAVFLNGEVLGCNTTWTAERPYVIYNSVLVDTLCTLHIEPGARIYSHNASYVLVQGKLVAEGNTAQPITFTNDRFEETFVNAPGQWGGIVMLEGSGPHIIDHAVIRNARTGIYLGTPDDNDEADLILSNTVIENMGGGEALPAGEFEILPGFGILAFNSDLYAYNVLIDNCEFQCIGNYAGGNYRYEHCTIANFSFDFFRQSPSVLLADNVVLADNSILEFPLNFSMQNSLVWGSLQDEIDISLINEDQSEVQIENNLLRTVRFQALLGPSNIINQSPLFEDPALYNFRLTPPSPAVDAGIDLGITTDIAGKARDSSPDLGAYELHD